MPLEAPERKDKATAESYAVAAACVWGRPHIAYRQWHMADRAHLDNIDLYLLRAPPPMTASNSSSRRIALRGDLLDFMSAPEWGAVETKAVRHRPDHWLLIDGGRIVATQRGEQAPDDTWAKHDHRGRLILPGFIDSHVHSPQID